LKIIIKNLNNLEAVQVLLNPYNCRKMTLLAGSLLNAIKLSIHRRLNLTLIKLPSLKPNFLVVTNDKIYDREFLYKMEV